MMPAQHAVRARSFVRWTLRHGRALWLLALLLAVPAGLRTARLYLHLRGDLEALLPRGSPSVRAIDELRTRVRGLQHLGIVIDVGEASRLPAGERLADDLAARIRAYPPEMVRSVRVGDAAERAFFEKNAPLYAELGDLETLRARLEARRDYDVSRGSGLLLDEDSPPPPLDFSDLTRKYEQRAPGRRFPRDRFSSEDLHATLVLVDVGEFSTDRGRGQALLERIRQDLAALGGPQRYAPGMRVGYAGDVAISVEETSALLTDLSLSSVVVVVAVIAVLVGYYRWWRSVLVLVPPLLLATIYAFSLASLPPFGVTELNSNTAFLGSIIVGNGINFGIILLARYREERSHGLTVERALAVATWGARRGTLMAALAAGTSYLSLVLTEFRGFRQFGVIGVLGMLLSWAVTFVLVPPLVAWLDHGPPPSPEFLRARGAIAPRLARFVGAWHRPLLALGLVLALLAAWKVRRFGPADIETDFATLRRADTWKSGEGYWGRTMDGILGTYLTPAVVLADEPEQAAAIERVLDAARARPPMGDLVASIRTIDDLVPRDQPAKIAAARAIRRDLSPGLLAHVAPDERLWLDRWLASVELRPLTAADLPATWTTGLVERDGTSGRTVLVYPHPSRALWKGAPLEEFVDELRSAARTRTRATQGPARVASSLALSADILASIQRDGPRVSVAAFLAVAAVTWAFLRRARPALLVVGSLALAVLLLVALTMTLGVRVNFANFIAFPITFGIGVDYAVNVVSRHEQEGARDIGRVVGSTGGAVALCSLTTVIGYSSLLMAENRALFFFGVIAVLGELCCLVTALVFLPAFVQWQAALHARRGRTSAAI